MTDHNSLPVTTTNNNEAVQSKQTLLQPPSVQLVRTIAPQPTQQQDKLSSLPLSQQSTILAHRIQKTCKTVALALQVMEPYQKHYSQLEDAWMAVLQLCGKHKDYQQAVQICQSFIPQSDQCRSLAIAICGRCQQIDHALSLLHDSSSTHITTPAPYNSAIAACGTNRTWKDALNIIHHKMPKSFITPLTGNALLRALAKSQRGQEALQFLRQEFPLPRDRTSYHHTLAALLAQGNCLEQAVQLVLQDMRQEAKINPEVTPNYETYDRLIAALVAKRASVDLSDDQKAYYNTLLQNLQEASKQVPTEACGKQKKRKRTETADAASAKRAKLVVASTNSTATPPVLLLPWDFERWTLPKKGKGKTAYWALGTIGEEIIVGLHPNRNPSKNGIQLWFFRTVPGETKPQKVGFLLMINTPSYENNNGDTNSTGSSQFLGLRVTDDDRRNGWTKLFVAVWLDCCLQANLQPVTGKMNKPLLCLVLQHGFQFTPVDASGGVRARLLPSQKGNESVVRLTTDSSSSVKNLAGALSPRDIQEQNVQLVSPAEAGEGGRTIDVGGLLQVPCREVLQQNIDKVLQDKWKLSPEVVRGDGPGDTSSNPGKSNRPLTMSRLFLGV